jgi:hypothetical protein
MGERAEGREPEARRLVYAGNSPALAARRAFSEDGDDEGFDAPEPGARREPVFDEPARAARRLAASRSRAGIS